MIHLFIFSSSFSIVFFNFEFFYYSISLNESQPMQKNRTWFPKFPVLK
ncbi:hypothetical protein LBBP_02277 [Leptospira borgpetersenii serovar Ballum]|uniref:Uncharacterized protein n=1 Tax=Leptospira borgpetersenii serovar Ballum TaxID=280505 RepID=A0A0S2IS97_LEPBO|nr:hypothetical protein LBBP_02277 [Leptospira borgpetersenii serovar Ballum]